jgi:hypothetical protein
MSNTKPGGAKTAKTNKRKYGRNYYKRIGQLGGRRSGTGGFYHMKMTGQLDRLKQISVEAAKVQRRGQALEEA